MKEDIDEVKYKCLIDFYAENDKGNFELLLKLGLDPNIKHNGIPLLINMIDMAVEGNVDTFFVEKLVEFGIDLESKDEVGNTILNYSIRSGEKNLFLFLLDNGVNIESVNNQGFTPLLWSCLCRRIEFTEELLYRGANSNKYTANGMNIYDIIEAYCSGENKIKFLNLIDSFEGKLKPAKKD